MHEVSNYCFIILLMYTILNEIFVYKKILFQKIVYMLCFFRASVLLLKFKIFRPIILSYINNNTTN